MFEYLKEIQLDVMLILIGICGIISFFVLFSTSMPQKRKLTLAAIELGAMFLLIFDRYAYIYRGVSGFRGYWMVRISNFGVFFLILATLEGFNLYLIDLYTTDGGLTQIPRRLKLCTVLILIGQLLVIISQFTGIYYTFDEENRYQRSPGFVICYLIPFLVLILQTTVVLQYRNSIRKRIWLSLLLFTATPLIASIVQLFFYGLSINNLSIVAMGVLLYVFALSDMNQTVESIHRQEVEQLERQQASMSRLFEQTASALVNAIDEGKMHMNGHSRRVAYYAGEIARAMGKSRKECQEIYFAGLLHDVGKIVIPDALIGKEEELTEEEQEKFRSHTTAGEKILSDISEYSYLSVGAHYHHERYDGTGYPEGLKGDEIPETARIIAVADAYDKMTSTRNGRRPLPQSRVREEFVKESGARFDPVFAKAMLRMIDEDTEYQLREKAERRQDVQKTELDCDAYRSDISNGIAVLQTVTKVRFRVMEKNRANGAFSMPSLILFDALDGRVHSTEQTIVDNGYLEYGEIWFDGHVICTRARNIEAKQWKEEGGGGRLAKAAKLLQGVPYEMELGRYQDHLRVRITDGSTTVEAIAALPDSTRFAYVGLTGENCRILGIETEVSDRLMQEGDIPRIAEEISYTDRMESDLPNIQIDGYCVKATMGVPVHDGMRLAFHTMSVPTAHLVWHCPFIVLFYSSDKQMEGADYREFVLVRLDGEIVEKDEATENKTQVIKKDSFGSWEDWKEINKRGMECVVRIRRKGNRIVMTTENAGIAITNTTILDKNVTDVYVALTGDQCALTDIRVL